ncbi:MULTISPECIES: hypothetical protein [Streptomyces]|uniref:hypothetical protein n=1 Tax=Streptomyces TaxID=1883 RepID=UPI001F0BD279|nr:MULTISPECIES: hypothetical protein [Streptomyces]
MPTWRTDLWSAEAGLRRAPPSGVRPFRHGQRPRVEAVGAGDRTHANIAATAGSRDGALPSGTLSRLLRRLVEEKRVLAVDEPLSTSAGKPALYRIADSNLRLYLAALRSAQELVRRGRPEAAFRIVERRWSSWRGRAVEPLKKRRVPVGQRTAGREDTTVPGV